MPSYWSFLIVRAMYALGKEEICKVQVDEINNLQANLHLPQSLLASWEISSQTRHDLLSMVFSTWVRALSKLKCIIVYPTPSHSFWKWSWLCSWWGSIRVEVVWRYNVFKLYFQTKQMGSSNHSWPDSPVRPSCPLLHVRPSQVPPLLISSAFFLFAVTDLLES